MSRLLPGSSDPSAADILRLQKHCDRVRVQDQLQSLDDHDEEECTQLVLRIPSSTQGEPSSEPRFANPTPVGLGAFGLVFSCDDLDQDGKRVAVKILRASRKNDRIARERFQEEARVMAGFNHPNIVAVFGTGEVDQTPYLITEFADAGSVATVLLDNANHFTPRQAAWIVLRIADAIEEAHSTPILHRDIKPGNILLRRELPLWSEGLGLWPLLTDFGLSKNLVAASTFPLTFEGEVLGTLSYMSPEQVQGKPLKTQSDLFPLGVVLHELAYGQHPFLAENDFQTRSNIVQAIPCKLPNRARPVPASLDAIISKCLKKDPEDRYLHASDLAQDLESFLQGKPISVSPPSLWQSFLGWATAHPIASTFLATILCCVFAIILLLSREWRVQRELAQDSRLLAEDRAKISQLFLESMRATNSGINDTILSGQRVLPTALLQTLDRQIPLLEDALALEPNDNLLIRQLEIMYHYKSLCHAFSRTSENLPWEAEYSKALEARRKSLAYIETLIQRLPKDQNLRVSKINGEYFMSVLFSTGARSVEWREWIDKAIASADAFLKEYPNHADVLETTNKLRMDLFGAVGKAAPEEWERELAKIVDTNLSLLAENPSKTALLTYTAIALTQRSSLLLDLGRDAEAHEVFDQLEDLLTKHRDILGKDWHFADSMFQGYTLHCQGLARAQQFEEIVAVVDRWRLLVESLDGSNYIIIHNHRFNDREFLDLFPIYFRWLALSEIKPETEELRQAADELLDLIARCLTRSESDLDFVSQNLQSVDRAGILKRFIGEVKSGTANPVP